MKTFKVGQQAWYIAGSTISSGIVRELHTSRIAFESTTIVSDGDKQTKVPQAYEADINDVFETYQGASIALGRRLHGRK